jgi:hypothetical protein
MRHCLKKPQTLISLILESFGVMPSIENRIVFENVRNYVLWSLVEINGGLY